MAANLCLKFRGNDGGQLDSVVLMSSRGDRESFHCPVGKKLDNSEQLTVRCNFFARSPDGTKS